MGVPLPKPLKALAFRRRDILWERVENVLPLICFLAAVTGSFVSTIDNWICVFIYPSERGCLELILLDR